MAVHSLREEWRHLLHLGFVADEQHGPTLHSQAVGVVEEQACFAAATGSQCMLDTALHSLLQLRRTCNC